MTARHHGAARPRGKGRHNRGWHDRAGGAGTHAAARSRPEIPDDCQPENLGISELMVPASAAPGAGEEPWQ